MKKRTGFVGIAVMLIATVAVMVTADRASAVVNNYTAELAGTNEVPSLPNGYTGTANITIDTVTFEVCVDATTNVPASDPIILDHIHSGAAGVNGPIVVDFMNNLDTCVISNATTVGNIVANPSAFYFNVHSTNHPGGALRGQLELVPPPTVLIDCDRVAGTAKAKPGLDNTIPVLPVSVSFKNSPDVGFPRTCTGDLAASAGPLSAFKGKVIGNFGCDSAATGPGTPYPPNGKVTNTYTTPGPNGKPVSSALFVRLGSGATLDTFDIANGIVTKGVGVGADVVGDLLQNPIVKKNPVLPNSTLDANGNIVPGAGSLDLGLACVTGVPGAQGITTITDLIFSTDGTSLVGPVVDSSIALVLPG